MEMDRPVRLLQPMFSRHHRKMQTKTVDCLRPKYGAILADPPWSFRNWSAKGTGRNAVSHYDCLDFGKLAAMSVADAAETGTIRYLMIRLASR